MISYLSFYLPKGNIRGYRSWTIGITLGIGLLLSFLSWLEICVEHCSANQVYRLFGLPFGIAGIIFFSFALLLHLIKREHTLLNAMLGWSLTAALGSEFVFIFIQKYHIGKWCPVCLSIAVSLLLGTLVFYSKYLKTSILTLQERKGNFMKKILPGLTAIPFFFLGLFLAFFGVSKVDTLLAAEDHVRERIVYGKPDSPIEIYFASDWFCPACRKMEFLIEKLLPEVSNQVAFYFVDYPVHTKSLNFSPYNLSFMVNNHKNYLKARQLLFEVARENDAPTDHDIEKAAKERGLAFKELPYFEVKAGLDYFDTIVKKFNLGATPSIVITNTKTKKTYSLEGSNEISEKEILKAIEKAKQGL